SRSGVRCADTTRTSWGTPSASRVVTARSIVSQSERDPMMTPTRGEDIGGTNLIEGREEGRLEEPGSAEVGPVASPGQPPAAANGNAGRAAVVFQTHPLPPDEIMSTRSAAAPDARWPDDRPGLLP